MKKLLAVLMTVLMLAALGCTAFAASDDIGVKPGEAFPDFTVSLTEGGTATLSELLKEKDLVVLNIFASWCGPCEVEFPEMEKSYQAHSDRMVILSLSGDPADTMQIISDYKVAHKLSFPMGLAGNALDFLNISGFPTTIFITKDGTVGFIKVGAFVGEGAFEEKVATFLSDSYDGNPLPSEIASSHQIYLLLVIPVIGLLLVIGRWLILRKAGKPGWHSLIPFLSSYQEYAICWKGSIGLVASLLPLASGVGLYGSHANWALLASVAIGIAYFVLRLIESLKLAKAFGKGAGVGILLTLFQSIGRFILGVSKAKYQGTESTAPAA
ncbi:MAG: redoxin domain-containing protein [Candidatus Limivicinus sp.]